MLELEIADSLHVHVIMNCHCVTIMQQMSTSRVVEAVMVAPW